jgi:hypothetical protein
VFDQDRNFAFLRYEVEGKGKQILNLGFGPEAGGLATSVEWSIVLKDNTFASQGQGWTITHDGTLTIDGANGNVTVFHNNILSAASLNTNLSFYEQHSVAIALAIAVAVVIVAAVIVNVNIKRRKDDVV